MVSGHHDLSEGHSCFLIANWPSNRMKAREVYPTPPRKRIEEREKESEAPSNFLCKFFDGESAHMKLILLLLPSLRGRHFSVLLVVLNDENMGT